MEFTPELLMFQGAILSANNDHFFEKLNSRGGNEKAINEIVAKLYKFLKEKNYVNENGLTVEGKLQMRYYCFFLILNSSCKHLNILADMNVIEHIVFQIPTINRCLISDIIWGLHMDDYLKEILIFSNPHLVVQILEQFAYNLRYLEPTNCLKQLNLLLSACYKFTCRLHFFNSNIYNDSSNKTILAEAYDNFLLCLNYYVEPPNVYKLTRLSEEEQDIYKGHYLQSLLTLTMECLNCYLSPIDFKCEGFDDVYLSTICPNDITNKSIPHKVCESENKPLQEQIEKYNIMLVDKLQALIMDVTVDVFCSWVDSVDGHGKSMQQTIRENCYRLQTQIKDIPLIAEHPLMSMLPQMSCKPADVHDIIKTADIDMMVQNANRDSEEKIHWLQAITNSPVLSKDERLLETLLLNINSIECNDREKIFKMMVDLLKDTNNEHVQLYKVLATKVFALLEDEAKVRLALEHFPDRHFQNNLQTDEFNNMKTEIFNKLVLSPNSNIHDVYNIFVQNPFEVYTIIVSSAVDNQQQCDLMLKIMIMLKPFVYHFYDTDTDPTFFNIILKVCKNPLLTDNQHNNLVYFIGKLKRTSILCEVKLLLLIILPGLHEALVAKDMHFIKLNTQLLSTVYETTELLKYRAPLLAMIAQILEVVRWTTNTFVPDGPTILDVAIHLQMKIFNTYESQIPAKEANWLKNKLHILQPLNMYYFKEIWNPVGRDYLGIIAGHKELTFDQLTVLMAKILPCLTRKECQSAWNCIVNRSSDACSALHCLHSSLHLLCAATDDTEWPCLFYCYNNYALVIKDYLSEQPLTNDIVKSVIDEIIILCNMHRAEDVKELSRTLLPLISYIIERKNDYDIDISLMSNKLKHASFAAIVDGLFTNKN